MYEVYDRDVAKAQHSSSLEEALKHETSQGRDECSTGPLQRAGSYNA